MPQLVWEPGAFPAPGQRTIPVLRFHEPKNPKRRWLVWFLGDAIQRGVHFKSGVGSVPCLKPQACPICTEFGTKSGGWSSQLEAYAPALVERKCRNFWDPVTVVLTAGVMKTLLTGRQLRGVMAEFYREFQGTSARLKFELRESQIEPTIDAFDIRPVMESLWDPLAKVELPEVEPIPTGRVKFEPKLSTPTPAEERSNRELLEAISEAEKRGEKFNISEYYARRNAEREAMRAALEAQNRGLSAAEVYKTELEKRIRLIAIGRDSSPDRPKTGPEPIQAPENASDAKPAASKTDSGGTQDRLPEPQPAKTADEAATATADVQAYARASSGPDCGQVTVGSSAFEGMTAEELLKFVDSFDQLPSMAELVRLAKERLKSVAPAAPARPAEQVPSVAPVSIPMPNRGTSKTANDSGLSLGTSEDPLLLSFDDVMNRRTGSVVCDDENRRIPANHPAKHGKKGGSK